MSDLSEENPPYSTHDLEQAEYAIKREVIQNPMAEAKDGSPLLPHYLVILRALKDELARRKG